MLLHEIWRFVAFGQSAFMAIAAGLFRVALVAKLVHCPTRPPFAFAQLDKLNTVPLKPLCIVAHEFVAFLTVIGRVTSIAHRWLFCSVTKMKLKPLLVMRRWTTVLVAGLAEERFVAIAATCWVFANFKLVVGKPVLFKVGWRLLGFNRRDWRHS